MRAYPSPNDISYDEDSRWCQEHGHTGLLLEGYGICDICERLVHSDPWFAAIILGREHNPDGSRAR
jgi:hypothetical protein